MTSRTSFAVVACVLLLAASCAQRTRRSGPKLVLSGVAGRHLQPPLVLPYGSVLTNLELSPYDDSWGVLFEVATPMAPEKALEFLRRSAKSAGAKTTELGRQMPRGNDRHLFPLIISKKQAPTSGSLTYLVAPSLPGDRLHFGGGSRVSVLVQVRGGLAERLRQGLRIELPVPDSR